MAAKIRVKGEPDKITKNAACCLVRRLEARWVTRNAEIERVTPPEHAGPITHYVAPGEEYTVLPYSEIPGIMFEPPAGQPRRRWLAIPSADVLTP
jgi:hypothetical protein